MTKGTRFSVELPKVDNGQAISGNGQKPSLSDPGVLGHQIVLLIENDTELRQAITLTLESWGLDVFPCTSEAEAIALLHEVDIAPDCVIADFQLDDGLLGTDAVANLRDTFGPIPACIITANRTPTLIDTCRQLDAALIYKPLDLGELRGFLAHAPRG